MPQPARSLRTFVRASAMLLLLGCSETPNLLSGTSDEMDLGSEVSDRDDGREIIADAGSPADAKHDLVPERDSTSYDLGSVTADAYPDGGLVLKPSNPNATQQARRLLAWLASLKRRATNHLMFGQWAGWRNESTDVVERIDTATGCYPAIVGMPALRAGSKQLQTQPRLDSAYLIRYYKKGGLIQLDDHGRNPWTGAGPHDHSGANNPGQLFRAGDPANSYLMGWLSDTADELQKYEDAGVVVLWRPYHEMNMGWPWWARIGSDSFKRLWRLMYDYFTQTRKLDNLLWVFAPSGMRGAPGDRAADWYPGDRYVDVVSADIYADFLDDPDKTTTRWFKGDFYPWAVSTGKPIGLSEYGRSVKPPFDQVAGYVDILREVKSRFSGVVFILAWNDKERDLANNNVKGVFSDPFVMTRDEVDWR